MPSPILEHFQTAGIGDLAQRALAEQFAVTALDMDTRLPDGPEKSAGLRKLLEARDCFLRTLPRSAAVVTPGGFHPGYSPPPIPVMPEVLLASNEVAKAEPGYEDPALPRVAPA